jgi:rubrerythrin
MWFKRMLSEIPIKSERIEKKHLDREILRLAMIAELDAISLYEQLAAATENEDIKKILLDVAKEEKTHVGEFQTLLLKEDKQQVEELEHGKEEVEEMLE